MTQAYESWLQRVADNLFPGEPIEDVKAMFDEWPGEMQQCSTLSDFAIDWLYRYRKAHKDINGVTWYHYAYVPRTGWFVSGDTSRQFWFGPLTGEYNFERITAMRLCTDYLPKHWVRSPDTRNNKLRRLH